MRRRSQGRISRDRHLPRRAPRLPALWRRTRRVPVEDIVLLFAAPWARPLAADLAVQVPCRSLILESAYTNSQDMARLYMPFMFDWRPSVPYDNLGGIGKIPVPLLVIHGEDDESSPWTWAAGSSAAPDPKELYIIPRPTTTAPTWWAGQGPILTAYRPSIHRKREKSVESASSRVDQSDRLRTMNRCLLFPPLKIDHIQSNTR